MFASAVSMARRDDAMRHENTEINIGMLPQKKLGSNLTFRDFDIVRSCSREYPAVLPGVVVIRPTRADAS